MPPKNKLRFHIYNARKKVLNDLNMIGLEDAIVSAYDTGSIH